MEVQLRKYRKQDFKALENIIRETWHYDEFSSPKTAAKLARVFLSSCLTNYTFSIFISFQRRTKCIKIF